jgi:hypothetical protein
VTSLVFGKSKELLEVREGMGEKRNLKYATSNLNIEENLFFKALAFILDEI